MAGINTNVARLVEGIKSGLSPGDANTLNLEPYRGELTGVDGWLSKNGTFYACSYHDHLVYADKLCSRMGYKKVNRFPYELNGEYTLEQMGWIKISMNKIVVYKDMGISKRQLDFLFDYYVSNSREGEFVKILEMYDNS